MERPASYGRVLVPCVTPIKASVSRSYLRCFSASSSLPLIEGPSSHGRVLVPCVPSVKASASLSYLHCFSASSSLPEVMDGLFENIECGVAQNRRRLIRKSSSIEVASERALWDNADVVSDNGTSSSTSVSRNDSVLRALQQLYGDNSTFNSKSQRRLVDIALGCEENVVAIIPTGGGKSVTWLIPALLETDIVTAVVIPFKALLLEQLSVAKSYGIPTHQWTASDYLENGVKQDVRVLFLAMESIGCKTFRRFNY